MRGLVRELMGRDENGKRMRIGGMFSRIEGIGVMVKGWGEGVGDKGLDKEGDG
jgi:hypothetical protein